MQFSSLSKVSWIATDWSMVKTVGYFAWQLALPTRKYPREIRGAPFISLSSESQAHSRRRNTPGAPCSPTLFPLSIQMFLFFLPCWPGPTLTATHRVRIAPWTRSDVTRGRSPAARFGLDLAYTSGDYSKEDYVPLIEYKLTSIPYFYKVISRPSHGGNFGCLCVIKWSFS